MEAALDSLTAVGLADWTPVRVRTVGIQPQVDWALVDRPFTDPFFEQTADRAMRHPFNLVFGRTTPLSSLAVPPAAQPAGFVFHMSRCGSTVIAQMLAACADALVVSEAQPLDALLRLRGTPGIDDDALASLLRGMVGAFAGATARGTGGLPPRRVVVKWHAWHVLALPLIVRAFPDVPRAFVFREPRAVLRSQERATGAELVPGTIDARLAGVEPAAIAGMHRGEYGARVLAAFCNAALDNAVHAGGARMSFVDYAALPGAAVNVASSFGFALSDGGRSRMADAGRLDTKESGMPFRPRTGESTPAYIDELATRWLDAPYAALREAAGVDGDRGDR